MARRILGLDIGSHAIKAVEFRQTLRDLEVVQLRCLPLVDPAPALAVELREFLQLHDLPTDHVAVALSGDRISTRRLSFPFRDRKKIAPAVRHDGGARPVRQEAVFRVTVIIAPCKWVASQVS